MLHHASVPVMVFGILVIAAQITADEPKRPQPLPSQSATANKLLADYQKKKADLEKAYLAKVAETNKKHDELEASHRKEVIARLEQAKVAAAKAVNLKEANNLQTAINQLKAESSSPSVVASKKQPDKKKAMTKIPAGAVRFKGNSYYLFKELLTMPAAQERCEALDGHLLRINDAEEQAFIQKWLGQHQPQFTVKGRPLAPAIDGSDRQEEGKWLFSDGTPMTFFNWDKDEPGGGGGQSSIAILSSGRWRDTPELEERWFICEWDGNYNPKPKIPTGAVKFRRNSYYVFTQAVTTPVARQRCEAVGGHLVRINDAEEQAFITRLVGGRLEFTISTGQKIHSAAIDGMFDKDSGSWTFSDGQPMTYFNWVKDDPIEPEVRQTIAMLNKGLWKSKQELEERWFICEWEGEENK